MSEGYMTKAELLAKIEDEHQQLTDAIDYLSVRMLTLPGLYEDNDWTPKDILTHVAAWEQLLVGWLAQRRLGETPHPPAAAMWQTTDQLNEVFHAKYKDYNWEQAWDVYDHGYPQLLAELDKLSDAALNDPTPFDHTTERPLLDHIAANTYEHYPEHTQAIMEWREREGL